MRPVANGFAAELRLPGLDEAARRPEVDALGAIRLPLPLLAALAVPHTPAKVADRNHAVVRAVVGESVKTDGRGFLSYASRQAVKDAAQDRTFHAHVHDVGDHPPEVAIRFVRDLVDAMVEGPHVEWRAFFRAEELPDLR